MPRPTSKDQLLSQAREEFAALSKYLATLTDEQKTVPSIVGDWAVKDVVAHLSAWITMFLDWYSTGKRGEEPITPARGYTWQQIPALNQYIYESHRDEALDDVLAHFQAAHNAVITAIESMSNEELFTPKLYRWTKSTTLGAYVISATCSHYAWARKEIRKGLKAQQTKE